MKTRSSTFLVLAALGIWSSGTARAQYAPLGSHRGGDAGATLSPASGSQRVALSLPPERDGLPVPLEVAFAGGSKVGAAGAGWTIPLSYVSVSSDITHRRPRYLDGIELAPPQAARRVTLVLAGVDQPMVDIGQQRFRPVVGDQRLELRELATSFELLDGNGVLYRFERLADLRDGPFLLVEIRGSQRDRSRVVVRYTVTPVDVSGPGGDEEWISELALSAIEYDYDATGTCGKHRIELAYRDELAAASTSTADGRSLLGLEILDGASLVRTRVLSEISVLARPDGACAGGMAGLLPGAGGNTLRLRRYDFRYQPDGDTTMPRLVAVDMVGRADSPEGVRAMPVARYRYGQVTHADGSEPHLQLADGGAVVPPPGDIGIATQERAGTVASTTRMLADFTGDGLPDIVSASVGQPFAIARNLGGQAFAPRVTVPGAPPALSIQDLVAPSYDNHTTGNEPTWTQTIDWNGDGRLDVIDAKAVPYHWRVYLNEPGAGQPGIAWRTIDLDVRRLLEHVQAQGLWTVDAEHLPVALSFTGSDLVECVCHLPDFGGPCVGEPNRFSILSNYTMVLWRLMDANGDGYPDFVSNSAPIEEQPMGGGSCPTRPGDDPEWLWFDTRTRFAPGDSNEIVVFLNRAGARPVPGTLPFSDRVTWFGSGTCAVEDWVAEYEPLSPEMPDRRLPRGSRQDCGFADLDGDGLPDRIEYERAYLSGPALGRSGVTVELPGPQSTIHSEHALACEAGVGDGDGIDEYQLAGYIDISGDGLLDYVANSGAVHLGSGFGFGRPLPVEGGSIGLRRSHQGSDCDGPSLTVAGMFDLDGDGRPQRLTWHDTEGSGPVLQTYHLVSAAGVSGALDIGRLTSAGNGHGAQREYHYDNAKRHTDAPHQVPHAEIVLARDETTTSVILGGVGGGALHGPRFHAYGEPQRTFDWARDRWTFRGYRRTATIGGRDATPDEHPGGALPPGEEWVFGTIRVEDHHRATDLATNHARYALVGAPRDSYTRAGAFSNNPWPLLALDLSSDVLGTAHGAYHGESHATFQTALQALSGYAELHDCTGAITPYHPGGPYILAGDGTWDRPCRSYGRAAPATTSERRGSAPTGSSAVETRMSVVQRDTHGRPTLIRHDGDLHVTDDDLCEEITYAVPLSSSPWRPLHAVRRVRKFLGGPATHGGSMDCSTTTRTVSVRRFTWDGLAEGAVSSGRLASVIVERHDIGTGTKLEEWTSARLVRATDGRVTAEETLGSGTTRTVAFSQFDHFGIVPTVVTQTATGVAGSLVVARHVDPWSLDELSVTDPNQRRERTTYDGYGRPRAADLLDPATGLEHRVAAWDYLGETEVSADGDRHDPLGRRVRARRFLERIPSSVELSGAAPLEGETWNTTHLDALGQPRFSEVDRGADYAEPLLVGEVVRDSLGRPVYVADAHVPGAAPYGTTYLYGPDGAVRCWIRGRGDQHATSGADVTDPAVARFATCVEQDFAAHRLRLRSQGAEERRPGGPAYRAYDEVVLTAIGREVERSRETSAGTLERVSLAHDVLGNRTVLMRDPDPAVAGPVVTWQWAYDSLGRVLRADEPGVAQVRYDHDQLGALVAERWTDGANERSIRNTYDGFGRRVRSAEYLGANEIAGTADTFAYDVPSGEPWHTDTAFLKGRLSHAHSAAMHVYFGYDGEGAERTTVRVDASGARVETTLAYSADGAPTEIGYALPDHGYIEERASYQYDSAGVIHAILWNDGTSTRSLFESLDIDELGRPLHALHGNGVEETWSYRPDDRRELIMRALALPTGEHTSIAYTQYDSRLRITERVEESTIGAGRHEMLRFDHDADNRLDHFTATSLPSNALVADQTYAYDALGNLTRITDGIAGQVRDNVGDTVDLDRLCRVSQYAIGSPPPGAAPCTYAFDARGNALRANDGSGLRHLQYDTRQRVTRVSRLFGAVAQYAYGPMGDVVRVDVTNSNTGDGRADRRYGDLVERTGPTLATARYQRIIPAPGGAQVVLTGPPLPDQPVRYVHTDASGTRAIFDGAGHAVQEIDYAPFGVRRRNTAGAGSSGWRHQFNGGERLTDFAMDQLGARTYEPATGRFLQRDPIIGSGASGRMHPYAFAWNDPITYADPTGLCPECDELMPWSSSGGGVFGLPGVGFVVDMVFGSVNAAVTPPAPWTPPEPVDFGPMPTAFQEELTAFDGQRYYGNEAFCTDVSCVDYINVDLTQTEMIGDTIIIDDGPRTFFFDLDGNHLGGHSDGSAESEDSPLDLGAGAMARGVVRLGARLVLGQGVAVGRKIVPAAAGGEAQALVKYDANFAAQQTLKSTTNVTQGGRTISVHAAERMMTPPTGRAPTTMAEIDQFLDSATQVRKISHHPMGDTITLRNSNAPRVKEVVVDAATGRRVITVIKPNR